MYRHLFKKNAPWERELSPDLAKENQHLPKYSCSIDLIGYCQNSQKF